MARRSKMERLADAAQDRLLAAKSSERLSHQGPPGIGLQFLKMAHCDACAASELAAQAHVEASSAGNQLFEQFTTDLQRTAASFSVEVSDQFPGVTDNPLSPGMAPPQFQQGRIGDSIWRYRGEEITVKRTPKRKIGPTLPPWRAEWTDNGDRRFHVYGTSEQAALGNARYRIDVERESGDFQNAEIAAEHTLSVLVDTTPGIIDRPLLARAMEFARTQIQRGDEPRIPGRGRLGGGGPSITAHPRQFEDFHALPLPTKLLLLDELLALYHREGRLSDDRYRPTSTRKRNPRKKKGTEKRTTRAERKRILRRLLRL